MERRTTATRRQEHLFVADDRRKGPYDRRGDDDRRLERVREREKIERIRSFKAKDKAAPPESVTISKKQVVCVGLALLVIVVAVVLLR